MKKKMMTLALAAIFTMGGLSAMAQTTQQDRPGDKKECCKKDGKKCDKKDGKKCGKEGKCDKKKECKKAQQSLFQGLNLTEQQKAAIAQIPNPRQVMKAARENAKESKQDQKMSKEMREAFVKNVRADYLNSIKGVLTGDQYVQFLENFFTDSQAMKSGKGHGDKMKDGKKMKDAKKMSDRKKGPQGKERGERRSEKR